MTEELIEGDVVVCTYGHNEILNKPFTFLYEFGYYTEIGLVVYIKGERNMQDSYAFKPQNVRKATEEDIKTYSYGK